MKRNDKQTLLAESTEALQQRIPQLQAELVRARQERFMQDKSEIDTKHAFKTRKQIKMIRAELTRRTLEAELTPQE